MRYHGEYEVDSAFIDGGSINWELTGNGEFILGTKGGRKYFIKRNIHVRYPSKGEPKAVYDKYKAEADAIYNKQKQLAKNMSGLSSNGDHIVVEEANFWDDENMFATVTAYIDGILPATYDYTSLSLNEFLNLSKDSTLLLQKLHAHNVIHGDLKEKNIVVAKQKGKYVPYLIDFDSSYATDKIPEWDGIGGSEGYQSPEILLYGSDEGAADSDIITTATDIFTLGIVLHRWWCGAFPSFDLDGGSVGAAVYLDKPVMIANKFDVIIGDNCGATLMSLINWMFAKTPSARPTAEQVLAVLSDNLEVPEEYHNGSDVKPFDTELWTAHKLVAELYAVATLKKKGVKSFKRIKTGCGSKGLKYQVTLSDGTSKTLSIEEVIESKYAKAVTANLDEPWDEHSIELISPEQISAKGYAKITKIQLSFRKRYMITTNSGLEFDKGYDWLISEGLAKPKIGVIDADTPWPEHGSTYVPEIMTRIGINSISRIEIGGEHRYKVIYNEIVDGKNKVNDKVSGNNLKIMGVIK
ncbi:MAG: hypothetical protein ACI4QN_06900 [Candidatus Coproplasma sp.]